MRFVFNFFFFGILFYLIYIFFPDAFHTLVSWAGHVYSFLHDLVMWAVEKVHPAGTPAPAVPEAPKAMVGYILTVLGY